MPENNPDLPDAALGRPSPLPTSGVLFYDPVGRTGTFYEAQGGELAGDLAFIGQGTGWRSTWSQIVPGNFGGGTQRTDLLFYDPKATTTDGAVAFFAVDANGQMHLMGSDAPQWSPTWTHIVPGHFGGVTGLTDLLFYDGSNGVAKFFASAGDGTVTQIGETRTGWRRNWTHVVPGHFKQGAAQTDLFFYDTASGDAEFWATDVQLGTIHIGRGIPGWRQGFGALIVPGDFGSGSGHTDLFCLSGSYGAFFASDGEGHIEVFGSNNLPASWTHIAPGRFSGPDGLTDLLFYDRQRHEIQMYSTTGKGDLNPLGPSATGDVSETVARLVPGTFVAPL
ncbi:hypothetical protein [Streptomyces sp. NPDC048277]|uniref:hypothetical protein n=1 Tax=Streptomyces sp. NPDC048277 TaxID=3155027 RepID=UPI0033E5AE19